MIELFDCIPMNARIGRKQCAHNRKQADDHKSGRMADARCKGCAGLSEAVIIDPEGIMAKKHCTEKGCTTVAWSGGFCWKHHPDHIANKKAACADKQAIRDIHKSDRLLVTLPAASQKQKTAAGIVALVQVEEILLCDECGNEPCLCVAALPESFGKVINGDGDRVPYGVDEVIYFALEDALNAKKNEWMVELSGLKPIHAIHRTAEILKLIEGWGEF